MSVHVVCVRRRQLCIAYCPYVLIHVFGCMLLYVEMCIELTHVYTIIYTWWMQIPACVCVHVCVNKYLHIHVYAGVGVSWYGSVVG